MYCAALAVSSSFIEKATERSSFFIPSANAAPSGKVNAGLIPTVIKPPSFPAITLSITGLTSPPFSERVNRGLAASITTLPSALLMANTKACAP